METLKTQFLKKALAELKRKELLAANKTDYSDAEMWLQRWTGRVHESLEALYDVEVANAFLARPRDRAGATNIINSGIWQKRTEHYRKFLGILLVESKEESLPESPLSLEQKAQRDDLIERLLNTWNAFKGASQISADEIHEFHYKSLGLLKPHVHRSEFANFEKCAPARYGLQFIDGAKPLDPLGLKAAVWAINKWVLTLTHYSTSQTNAALPAVEIDKLAKHDVGPSENKRVFIIHGHDRVNLLELEKLINGFGLEPVIMMDQVTDGFNLFLDKFETIARSCNYAVALITKDDCIEKNGEKIWQGRPNTIFELGWFCRHFERKRMMMLVQRGCDIWSDLQGVEYYRFVENVDEAYRKMHETLKVAGMVS